MKNVVPFPLDIHRMGCEIESITKCQCDVVTSQSSSYIHSIGSNLNELNSIQNGILFSKYSMCMKFFQIHAINGLTNDSLRIIL